MRDNIINIMKQSDATFGKVVSLYLKNTHICLDYFYNDFENVIQQVQKHNSTSSKT